MPEDWTLTAIQAHWLAEASGLAAEELVGRPLGEVHERLRFVLEPELLLFRKVCGRVVKQDPVTGAYHGVPNATVHVEDTDGTFLGFFPEASPYFWLWPLLGRREALGATVTDSCGRFCVWVPRWDIDRVLRLRRRRVCLPDLVKPDLRDLLERLRPDVLFPRSPWPGPDPDPPYRIDPRTLPLVREAIGAERAERLASLTQSRTFGEPAEDLGDMLGQPAFFEAPAPPLQRGLAERLGKMEHPVLQDARRLGIKAFDPRRYIGPFVRCRDVWELEWQTIADVPDITFRVTQDVDGDGAEETIYSEGWFDVRWNAGPIGDVTLVASALALASPFCEGAGEARECADKPALYAVGPMPLDAAYHDAGTGYAVRVNRPRAGGLRSGAPIDPARTPYAGYLALFACHRLPGATHQRVMYQSGSVGPVPLFVPTWHAPTTPGQPTPVVAFTQDVDGWIPIEPANTLAQPDWVLHWPTPPTGEYTLHVECRDGSGPVGTPSDAVAFTVDNRRCDLTFGAIRWRELPGGGWNLLSDHCPVVRRTPGATVQFEVPWSATSDHFRDANLTFGGCDVVVAPTSPVPTHDQWHDSVADTSGSGTATFEVAGTRPEGAYWLALTGWTRAFAPGFDAGPGAQWFYDPNHVHNQVSRTIAIVNDS